MKNLILALMCMTLMTVLFSPQSTYAKAKTEQVQAPDVQPIFDGTEDTKADSLLSYAQFVTSPEVKALITDAANTIKETPKDNTVESWYAYLVGVLGAIFGVWQYFKKAKSPQPVPQK